MNKREIIATIIIILSLITIGLFRISSKINEEHFIKNTDIRYNKYYMEAVKGIEIIRYAINASEDEIIAKDCNDIYKGKEFINEVLKKLTNEKFYKERKDMVNQLKEYLNLYLESLDDLLETDNIESYKKMLTYEKIIKEELELDIIWEY